MSLRRFLRGLTMRRRHERQLSRDVAALLERVHRLEMRNETIADDLEHQKARLAKLGTRLGGATGGRPRASLGGAAALDDIPRGDKRALRDFFAINPPKEH